MSKVFYDHYLDLDQVKRKIDEVAQSKEEKEELWNLVDEIVHHRVMGCIMDMLPKEHHHEFLDMFEKSPYDESLGGYLEAKTNQNLEELIRQEIGNLAFELLGDIKSKK